MKIRIYAFLPFVNAFFFLAIAVFNGNVSSISVFDTGLPFCFMLVTITIWELKKEVDELRKKVDEVTNKKTGLSP